MSIQILRTSRVDLGKDKLKKWSQINEKFKSMWSWPPPGEWFVSDKKIICQ